MTELKPNCRVWIYRDDESVGVFGDGKIRLLKAIAGHGSLRQAAESLGISYRKAWADLNKSEKCLQLKLVVRHRGGHHGGAMELTSAGRRTIAAYEAFREQVRNAVQDNFALFLHGIKEN